MFLAKGIAVAMHDKPGSVTSESVTSEYAPSAMSITSETRLEYLLRTHQALPRFLQGVYPFVGRGLFDLAPLHDELTYVVPQRATAQIVYFRAGNLSEDILYLTLSADGQAVRYFPVGPKSDFHVPLAIMESYSAGTRFQVCVAAPRGLAGSIVVDVGIIQISNSSASSSSDPTQPINRDFNEVNSDLNATLNIVVGEATLKWRRQPLTAPTALCNAA